MTEEVWRTFDSLSIVQRAIALPGLLPRLSDYEWRALQAALEQRSFQKDIIGSIDLPYEILILIFHHLPLNAVFKYQSVCKSWRSKLNNVETLNAIFNWHSGDLPRSLPYRRNKNLVDGLICTRKTIEHALRSQNGLPTRAFEIRSNPGSITANALDMMPISQRMKLAGSHFVWASSNFGKFHILNLRNGFFRTVTFPGRRYLLEATTSDFLIVEAANSLYAYQFSAPSNPPLRLRLPASHAALACHNHMAALVLCGSDIRHFERSVVVWDMSSGRSHSFTISFSKHSSCNYCGSESTIFGHRIMAWMHADSKLLTFLYQCRKRTSCMYIRIIQTNLAGKILYDEHLQFQSQSITAAFKFDHIFERQADSGKTRITIEDASGENKYHWSGIVFEIDTSSTPPLRPANTDFWLSPHPAVSASPVRCKFEGLQSVRGMQSTDLHSDEERQSWVPDLALLFHTYSVPDTHEQVLEYRPDNLPPALVHVFQTRLGSFERKYHNIKPTLSPGFANGPISYFAIANGYMSRGQDSSLGFVIELYVFTTTRWKPDTPLSIYGPRTLKISFEPSDQWWSTEVQIVTMNEDFVVVHLGIQRDDGGIMQDYQKISVVLAFDPEYVVPEIDDVEGVFTFVKQPVG